MSQPSTRRPATPPPARRRLVAATVALALLISACGNSDDDGDAAGGGSGSAGTGIIHAGYLGDYSLIDEEFGTMVSVSVEDGVRTIETNALPNHDTGDFPNDGNPNTITEQDLTWEFPSEGTFIGDASSVRMTGVAVNGVKFEPGTGESVSCSSGENYRIEALQDLYDLGLDFNNAHVQPTGEYHYHGISELLVDAYDNDGDLVHIGFASDGFLIYYSKSGAYDSGYLLSDEARDGEGCVASGPDRDEIDLAGTAPDGSYTSDYVYDEAAGDLDACNGTTIDGTYAYIVTDTYPFIGRCLNGEPSADAGGGGGQGGPPGGEAPDAAAPGQAPGG